MKKILMFLTIMICLPSCATIPHKNVKTEWQGYGVKLGYESKVAISPELIPEFINAVDRLETMLGENNSFCAKGWLFK